MKQLTIIVALFCYLFASSGVGVAKHFCSDKLNSVSVYAKSAEGCGCSKAKKSSCCHDEAQFLKIKDSHLSSKSLDTVVLSWITNVWPQLLYVLEYNLNTNVQVAFGHQFKSPPNQLRIEVPLSIKNCVWII